MAEKGVSWVEFLRRYVKYCGRISASTSFNGLFRIFEMALAKAGLTDKLQFESDDDGGGYNGPMLILTATSSGDAHDDNGNVRRWILGALTRQAFENRDMFYGSSGNLYAISPVFNVFLSSGKEKNFVYGHLHPTGRVYDPHPKPVGLAFGGSIGNERISIYEDFAKVILCHRAVDKTCQSGFIFPIQVDLKTFARWEDSREKMMMDMVSDPNRVQREDR